jgi:hypothetical protein
MIALLLHEQLLAFLFTHYSEDTPIIIILQFVPSFIIVFLVFCTESKTRTPT